MKRNREHPDPDIFTKEELKRLFAVAKKYSKRDYAIFLIGYRHGLRASEIGMYLKDDVNQKESSIYCRRLKGSLSRLYPLRPDELRAIRAYLRERVDCSPYLFLSRRGSPISRQQLDVLTKKYGEEAGIPRKKCHFHTLKHSIVTHILDASGDVSFAQYWVGHSNIQNTITYTHYTTSMVDGKARDVFSSHKIV